MSRHVLAMCLLAVGASGAAVDMRPEVVSKLLGTVQLQWRQEAEAAMDRGSSDAVVPAAMSKSCAKITGSIIQGSDGKKDQVQEYLSEVCHVAGVPAQEHASCSSFASVLTAHLTYDDQENREAFDFSAFCGEVYRKTVAPEAQKNHAFHVQQAAAHAEEEKALKAKQEADAKDKSARAAKAARQKAAKAQAQEAKLAVDKANADVQRALSKAATLTAQADALTAQGEGKDAKAFEDRARKYVQAAEAKDVAIAEAQAKKAAERVEALKKSKQVSTPKRASLLAGRKPTSLGRLQQALADPEKSSDKLVGGNASSVKEGPAPFGSKKPIHSVREMLRMAEERRERRARFERPAVPAAQAVVSAPVVTKAAAPVPETPQAPTEEQLKRRQQVEAFKASLEPAPAPVKAVATPKSEHRKGLDTLLKATEDFAADEK